MDYEGEGYYIASRCEWNLQWHYGDGSELWGVVRKVVVEGRLSEVKFGAKDALIFRTANWLVNLHIEAAN